MRILHIEDEPEVARAVEIMLKSKGHDVHTECDGTKGYESARTGSYDFVLLELELPSDTLSGMEVLRHLRKESPRLPIMVISRLADPALVARALHAGADDYLTKPFHKEELAIRISAISRRYHGLAESVIRVGNLAYDLTQDSLWCDQEPVPLSRTERIMMMTMMLHPGKPVSKPVFFTHLYAGEPAADLKMIDAYICKLRGKLSNTNATPRIETVWGQGYRLVEPRSP